MYLAKFNVTFIFYFYYSVVSFKCFKLFCIAVLLFCFVFFPLKSHIYFCTLAVAKAETNCCFLHHTAVQFVVTSRTSAFLRVSTCDLNLLQESFC